MSPTPGTLYEYDMILATSQYAINAQFVNLFNTPNPEDFTEMLIPNSMTLGYTYYDEDSKEWKDSDQGLTADEIECPTADINSIGTDDGLYRAARMSIKITTGTMTYDDDNGDSTDVTVDGWTFSWVAGFGATLIKDLDKAVMHPKAKVALKAALEQVPDEDFLAASIFCTFESTKVAKTFKLYDKDGSDVSNGTDASHFLDYFTTTYSHTDHLPWVLGHCVTQEIPHPTDDLPKFCPIQFWYSATPYSDDANNATVNFCMITSDPHDDDLVDPTKNSDAGVISPPFIDVTRASNLSSDGILAMSDHIFYKHWLKPTILGQMHAKPSDYTGSGHMLSSGTSGGKGKASCSKVEKFASGWRSGKIDYGDCEPSSMSKHVIEADYVSKWAHRDIIILTVNLNYSSILQDIPSGTIPVDTKRQVTIIVEGTITTTTEYKMLDDPENKKHGPSASYSPSSRQGIHGHTMEKEDSDNVFKDYECDFKFGFTISAAENGKWSVAQIPANKLNTASKASKSALPVRTNYHWTTFKDKIAVNKPDSQTLDDYDKSVTSDIISEFSDIDPKLEFSSWTIMPNGDVFTYLGLDCDSNGSLYSHVKYRTIT